MIQNLDHGAGHPSCKLLSIWPTCIHRLLNGVLTESRKGWGLGLGAVRVISYSSIPHDSLRLRSLNTNKSGDDW